MLRYCISTPLRILNETSLPSKSLGITATHTIYLSILGPIIDCNHAGYMRFLEKHDSVPETLDLLDNRSCVYDYGVGLPADDYYSELIYSDDLQPFAVNDLLLQIMREREHQRFIGMFDTPRHLDGADESPLKEVLLTKLGQQLKLPFHQVDKDEWRPGGIVVSDDPEIITKAANQNLRTIGLAAVGMMYPFSLEEWSRLEYSSGFGCGTSDRYISRNFQWMEEAGADVVIPSFWELLPLLEGGFDVE